jgi:hypothetical protein
MPPWHVRAWGDVQHPRLLLQDAPRCAHMLATLHAPSTQVRPVQHGSSFLFCESHAMPCDLHVVGGGGGGGGGANVGGADVGGGDVGGDAQTPCWQVEVPVQHVSPSQQTAAPLQSPPSAEQAGGHEPPPVQGKPEQQAKEEQAWPSAAHVLALHTPASHVPEQQAGAVMLLLPHGCEAPAQGVPSAQRMRSCTSRTRPWKPSSLVNATRRRDNASTR